MTWRQLTFSPSPSLSVDEVEGICSALIEGGAAGATIELSGTIVCFVDSSITAVDPLIDLATTAGCTCSADEEIHEENWSENCSEIWEPVVAGDLTIVPVQSLSTEHSRASKTILIIPGQGFGTGHHPTTRMIVEELSARAPALAQQELSIIDVGTGSGILAIAAAKLFATSVQAIDNDAYAISNAVDNVKLNELSHLIEPSLTPLEEISSPFNLIIANIYGEVLTYMAPHLSRLALPGCVMILSGITELVRDMVVDEYTEKHGWSVSSERSDQGWHCVTLTRS
jgi:ribosomal protein L11 methyltransferase